VDYLRLKSPFSDEPTLLIVDYAKQEALMILEELNDQMSQAFRDKISRLELFRDANLFQPEKDWKESFAGYLGF
jgi:hypothetical protein